MRRGTTPTHIFTIPPDINMSTISKIQVVYSQNNTQVLCKNDCKASDNVVKVELTQEETFLFNHKIRAEIQLRLLTNDGKSMLSDVIIIGVEKCLSDEVLK